MPWSICSNDQDTFMHISTHKKTFPFEWKFIKYSDRLGWFDKEAIFKWATISKTMLPKIQFACANKIGYNEN